MTTIDHAAYIAAADPPTMLALLDELEGYRRWKAEAVGVLLEWEETWVAAGRPGRLGTSKAASVREEIERLRGEWEYGAAHKDDPEVGAVEWSRDKAVEKVDAWNQADPERKGFVVRRRKAGPWEPVEGDGDA